MGQKQKLQKKNTQSECIREYGTKAEAAKGKHKTEWAHEHKRDAESDNTRDQTGECEKDIERENITEPYQQSLISQ